MQHSEHYNECIDVTKENIGKYIEDIVGKLQEKAYDIATTIEILKGFIEKDNPLSASEFMNIIIKSDQLVRNAEESKEDVLSKFL